MTRHFMFPLALAIATLCTSARAIVIVPQSVAGYPANSGFIHTIDGSGLQSPLITGAAEPAVYPTHIVGDSSDPPNPTIESVAGRAFSASIDPLDYHLGGVFNLTGLKLWNDAERYQGFYYNDRGINAFTLEFSTDNGATYSAPISLTATPVAEGPVIGESFYGPESFPLSQTGVTDVRLTASSNHGGDVTGISELAFTGSYLFKPGDYNDDGLINLLDWPTQRDNYLADFTGLTVAQGFQKGDFDLDGDNDLQDQSAFKMAFLLANPGSTLAALATVPEPGSVVLLAVGAFALARFRRAKVLAAALVVVMVAAFSSSADAQIIQPVSATAPTEVQPFSQTIDGSGLSSPLATGDPEPAVYPTHQYGVFPPQVGPEIDGIVGRMNPDPNATVVYNLGARSNLTGMALWNYTEEYQGGFYNMRGLASADLSFSSDGGATYSSPTSLTFNRAPDGTYLPDTSIADTAPEFKTFNATNVTNVKFSNLQNFGGDFADFVGFNEVRFAGEQKKLTLQVNAATGDAQIVNNTGLTVNLDFIELTSNTSSLDPTNWSPLDGGLQNGLGWDVLGSTSSQRLTQFYLGVNS